MADTVIIQNKRLYIARMGGLERTVERVSASGRKRLEDAKDIVLGDGSSTVHRLHDPAATIDHVTLGIVCTRDDPFVSGIEGLFELHRLNPQSADSLVLMAYADDGSTVDSRNFVTATIQNYKFSDGDVNSNGEGMFEFVVAPSDLLP